LLLYLPAWDGVNMENKWTRWESPSMEGVIYCLRAAVSSCSMSEDSSRLPRIPSTPTSPLVACIYLRVPERARWCELRWLAWSESSARLCDCCYHVRCCGDTNIYNASGLLSHVLLGRLHALIKLCSTFNCAMKLVCGCARVLLE